jgi:hypothetical protein
MRVAIYCSSLVNSRKPTPAGLHDGIAATFDAKELKAGTAWTGRGPDYFFAIDFAAKPLLFIDEVAGSQLVYAAARIDQVARLHAFYYVVDGKKFGGRLGVPAFTALSSM